MCGTDISTTTCFISADQLRSVEDTEFKSVKQGDAEPFLSPVNSN